MANKTVAATPVKLELRTILVPKRGRGGNGSSSEVQVLGEPVYPKDQKGEKIAESINTSIFAGFDVAEMTKFVSGLGFDPCVMMADGLNYANRSADARRDHMLKTKGNVLIALNFADDKNFAAKVEGVEKTAAMLGVNFDRMVEIMVENRKG